MMRETQDFRDFSITNWLETFKAITIRTHVIEIPQPLFERIASGDTDINLEEVTSTEFANLIKNAINEFQSNCFVKNNWHAPLDAKEFSLGKSLKVNCVKDILLYFGVSNIIQTDFNNIKGIPFCIAIKEWKNIHPAAEFRCIVIKNVLRGITPRDWPTFYEHFKQEGPQIIDKIKQFYEANIKLKFSKTTYTFDIVLSYPERPYILDFGPLCTKTNLYAFSWKEIQPLLDKETPEEVAPVFRYLESDIGIMTKAEALYKINKSTQM